MRLKTPPVVVVGQTFLKEPNFEKGTRFPRQGKNGNTNIKYEIKIGLNPKKDLLHKEFLKHISTQESIIKEEETPDIFHTVIKPKVMPVMKEGQPVLDENGKQTFAEIPDEVTLLLRSIDPIPVIENGNLLEGDDLLLDSRTAVEVDIDIDTLVFQGKDKRSVGLVMLKPKSINVLSRPERKGKFVKGKK